MDDDMRRAARRRATVAFVAAGLLLIVSVVGLVVSDGNDGTRGDDRPAGRDQPARTGNSNEHTGIGPGRNGPPGWGGPTGGATFGPHDQGAQSRPFGGVPNPDRSTVPGGVQPSTTAPAPAPAPVPAPNPTPPAPGGP